MQLKGTVALVTGGGTGVGRAVSLDLARAGAKGVVINYSRSKADAESTAQEVGALGAEALPIKANVASEAEVRAMVDQAVGHFGRLDVLVNNAGTTRHIPLADLEALTDEVWDSIFATNLRGAFYCCRAAAPHLKRSRGAIVNVASVAAFVMSGFSSLPYACSKAALLQLTRGLASALAPEVRVNAVCPGLVRTRWFREGLGEEAAIAAEKHVAQQTPLRDIAAPEHISQAVMGFLAGDFVTGQHLVVDGGRLGRGE